MRTVFRLLPGLFLLATLTLAAGPGCAGRSGPQTDSAGDPPGEVAAATLTKVGEPAPDFTVATLDGGSFTLADHRGKVVLVNWWATWCPPCVAEMPHLQSRVWERFKGGDFAMIAVSREETAGVVGPWVAAHGITFAIGLDPERAAYGKYASAFIPRSLVVDRDGTIIFQSQGYEEPEFAAMVEVIGKAIDAAVGEGVVGASQPSP